MLLSRNWLWVLIGLPLLEIYLITRLGARFGFLMVILWIVGAAAIGLQILRLQSWTIWSRVQQIVAAGQSPGGELLNSAFVVAGGILLIVPGIVTDLLALLCLLPPTRHWITRRVARRFGPNPASTAAREHPTQTIDGEFRRED
jgi:UPF0716 protein FxsA